MRDDLPGRFVMPHARSGAPSGYNRAQSSTGVIKRPLRWQTVYEDEEVIDPPSLVYRIPKGKGYWELWIVPKRSQNFRKFKSSLVNDSEYFHGLLRRVIRYMGKEGGGRVSQIPANVYILEDASQAYITEDGLTFFVTES